MKDIFELSKKDRKVLKQINELNIHELEIIGEPSFDSEGLDFNVRYRNIEFEISFVSPEVYAAFQYATHPEATKVVLNYLKEQV